MELKNFIEELKWRGMIHDVMPETEEHLLEAMRSAYVGFDPTADSLHIGHLVPIMLLAHYQRCGHKPYALVGGATGMIGDPSGKSDERNLLDEKTLAKNVAGVREQLGKFLDFESKETNAAVLVNNYDWLKDFTFLDFIRDVGKHITVNYMMSKDSVKKRLSGEANEGLSFTEFTYQLVQGYDFLHLYQTKDCTLQMGGSDQWGNITTGTEMLRRMAGAKGFGLTCPLITKSDGTKFGKSEGGNVWLSPDYTSPYKFYQYWLNASDADAENYIKIFTFLDKETIDGLIAEHKEAPHLRILQKRLAEEVTVTVHGQEEYDKAVQASEILFGKSTAEDLQNLDAKTFLEIFEGVPQGVVSKEVIEKGLDIISLLAQETDFLKSNGEARRDLKGNAISVNREKVSEEKVISASDLLNDKYILLQKGKRNYFVVIAE